MSIPKKTKFKKLQKGRVHGFCGRGYSITYGKYALISLDNGYISEKQIESARIVINRHIKKSGKLWILVFPNKPLTKKPSEIRMGKGKGSVDRWVACVKKGRILYEIDGITALKAKVAMKSAQAKLPIKTKLIFTNTVL